MTILLAIALLFLVRSIVRKPKRKPERTTTNSKPVKTNSVAALEALQEQRELIEDMLSDIEYQLDNAPKNRYQLLNRQYQLYSKLATVETKIHKML